jgi:hypothetical protein
MNIEIEYLRILGRREFRIYISNVNSDLKVVKQKLFQLPSDYFRFGVSGTRLFIDKYEAADIIDEILAERRRDKIKNILNE